MTVTAIGSGRGSGTFMTFSVTIPAGLLNSVIYILTSVQDSNHANIPVFSVLLTDTFESLSNIRSDEATGNNRTEVWAKSNPTSGTITVEVDTNGSVGEIAAFAYIADDVDIAKLSQVVNGTTGNAQNPSLDVVTQVNNSVVLSVLSTEASITGVGADQTITGPLTDQSFENAAGSQKIPKAVAGTDNQAFTTGSGHSYAISAVAVPPKTTIRVGSLLSMFQ